MSSFTPTVAAQGQQVVITGSLFTGATAVTFGGTNAASFVVDSDTQITAIVAAGTTGSVAVTTAGGTGSKTGFTFVDLNTGLIDAWNMNETSGASRISMVTGTVLTNNNAATRVSGIAGYATEFVAASSQSLTKTSYFSMQSLTAASISCWLKRTLAGSTIEVTIKHDGSNFFAVALLGDDGKLYANVRNDGVAYATVDLSGTDWHHVVVAFDGSLTGDSNRLKVYVDGVLQTMTFLGSAIPASLPTMPEGALKIGDNAWPGAYGNGNADALNLYSVALTQAQVTLLYNSGTPLELQDGSGNWASANSATAISNIPSTGKATGDSVVIKGTILTGATAVKFGGVDAASYVVDNDDQITATVGNGTGGVITVVAPGGTATRGVFSYVNTWTGGGANTNWSTTGNWDGNHAPSTGIDEDVVFDATSSTACVIDVAIPNGSVRSITATASGAITGAASLTHYIGTGGLNTERSGVFTWGSGSTWNIAGEYNFIPADGDFTNVTINLTSTAQIRFREHVGNATGAVNGAVVNVYGNYLLADTILIGCTCNFKTGSTINIGTVPQVAGGYIVTNTNAVLNIESGVDVLSSLSPMASPAPALDTFASGSMDFCNDGQSGGNPTGILTTYAGTIHAPVVFGSTSNSDPPTGSGTQLPPGTYSEHMYMIVGNDLGIGGHTFTHIFAAGTYTFERDWTVGRFTLNTHASATAIVSNSANNPNFVIGGNLNIIAGGQWTAGTGTITFTGTDPDLPVANNVTLTSNGQTLEHIIINAGVTVQLQDNLTVKSPGVTGAGTLDQNGFTVTVV